MSETSFELASIERWSLAGEVATLRPLVGVDPGPRTSGAIVLYRGRVVAQSDAVENRLVASWIADAVRPDSPAIIFEKVVNLGMPVGEDVFETVFQTGVMVAAVAAEFKGRAIVGRFSRKSVKVLIGGSAIAKDSAIRLALLERWGGKETAQGCKAAPGPLYGVGGHRWQALAVAVAWLDALVLERFADSNAAKFGRIENGVFVNGSRRALIEVLKGTRLGSEVSQASGDEPVAHQ